MPFDLGDTVRLEAACRSAAGTLTTAATAVVTITLPDGTTVTPAVAAPASAGEYLVDYPTVQAGRHAVRWRFTDPASAYTDSFDVREAEPAYILSLADARRHLRYAPGDTGDDEQIREWLETITIGVESFAGVCCRRTVTETHDLPSHGVPTLVLRRTPVLSLTSLTAVHSGGTSYLPADLDVDGPTGVVRRLDGGRLYGVLRGVYVAGRTVIPANLSSAARIILQHLWRTQYGASRGLSQVGGGDDYLVTEPIPGFGYAIPNRALQLLEPDRLPPGVA
ncbi:MULTISPECIES: hypothetical protein [Streptomyces]|uniref:hypothetical protein n=1 Tax=Streptomyces TaxID=1883 RepID=UPI0004BD2EB6|nr:MULTISPECIES: hypothetical protein [Streptomyces]